MGGLSCLYFINQRKWGTGWSPGFQPVRISRARQLALPDLRGSTASPIFFTWLWPQWPRSGILPSQGFTNL